MPLQLTPETFLAVVKQSGLVDGDRLQKLLNEFRLRGLKLESARSIADELVASNAITRWQAEKLLQGKHRGFFLGKYRLLSLLGKGGMSSVYLAEHTVMRRRCAIKVLPTKRVNDTSYLGRFHREAQAVANLDHPNIVRAYDVDKEIEGNTEIHFLVMEYVDGESLQEMVASRGVLDFVVATEYARQAAEGLVHAHAAGMVHRDIKPGNLLVDPNGSVKILDMGLARFFDDDDQESLTVTHDEKVLGTADYLAPEQALDSHTVDSRADIYSLGCTIYFMLTGHPPFTEGTLAQRLMSHQMKEPPSITVDRPNCPPDLLAIVNKMMAKDVNQRFQSSSDVSATLYNWLSVNADDTWRRKHNPAAGSGASRNGGQDGNATRDSLTGGDRRGLQFAPQGGLFTTTAAPPASTDNTANLTSSETETGGHDLRGVRQPAKPLVAPEDIPLAPLDEEDGSREAPLPARSKPADSQKRPAAAAAPTPRPADQRAQPQRPLKDSSPGKSPVAQTRQPGAAPAATGPGSAPTSPQRPAAAATKPTTAAPRPANGPKSGDSIPTTGAITQARAAQKPNPARPIAGDEHVEDVVAEALPIESLTPLAETVTPPPKWSTDSRMIRGGSSILRGGNQRNSKEKALVVGGGLILLLVVVVVVLVVVSSSRSPEGAGENAIATANAEVITVGPTSKFTSIAAALKHVRETFAPESANATRTIRVVGGNTYHESIQIDGGSNPSWLQGVRLVCTDEERAILTSPGPGPVISLDNAPQLTIEGFEIRATGKATAVELKGNLAGTKLMRLLINGFTKTGINGEGARGQETGQLLLTSTRIKVDSQSAVALHLGRSQFVTVRDCRFFGPMSAGILIDGDQPATRVEIEQTVFADGDAGIKIDAAKMQLSRLTIMRNTFHQLQHAIAFTAPPVVVPGIPPELKVQWNLFSQIGGAEGYLATGTPEAILKMADANGIEKNWAERTPSATADPHEIDWFKSSSRRGVTLQFISVDPTSNEFLVPRKGAEHKQVGALPAPLG